MITVFLFSIPLHLSILGSIPYIQIPYLNVCMFLFIGRKWVVVHNCRRSSSCLLSSLPLYNVLLVILDEN